jgi:aminopeptidase N
MTLAALRHKIGGQDMNKLLRTWVRRHRFGNATTPEFTSLAARISGQPLHRFFHNWLWLKAKPPFPSASRSSGSSRMSATSERLVRRYVR